MSSTWDARVEDAREEIQDVRYNLNEKSARQRDGGDVKALDRRIREGISNVEQAISDLDADLAFEESQRRNERAIFKHRRDLENLRHEMANLRKEQQRSTQAAERQHLLAAQHGSPGRGGYSAEEDYSGMDQQQLRQERQRMVRQQDGIIDELSVGVQNLAHLGRNIGEEADLHVRLLDDLEEDVDRAHRGLNQQTGRAKELNRDASSVCWMYVVICLLVLILVALVIFVFT